MASLLSLPLVIFVVPFFPSDLHRHNTRPRRPSSIVLRPLCFFFSVCRRAPHTVPTTRLPSTSSCHVLLKLSPIFTYTQFSCLCDIRPDPAHLAIVRKDLFPSISSRASYHSGHTRELSNTAKAFEAQHLVPLTTAINLGALDTFSNFILVFLDSRTARNILPIRLYIEYLDLPRFFDMADNGPPFSGVQLPPPPQTSAGAPGYENGHNSAGNPSHMPPPPLPPVIIPQNTNPIPTAITSPMGENGVVMSPDSAGGFVRRAAPEPNKRALYVGGLDPRVTEDVLRQIFETTGHVQNVKIIPDKNVGAVSIIFL